MTQESKPLPPVGFPHVIDGTMLTCFRSCPREFYLKYVLRRSGQGVLPGAPLSSAKPNIHLVAGGAFAAGLEAFRVAYYGERASLDECVERAIIAAIVSWGDKLDPFPPDRDAPHLTDAKAMNGIIAAIAAYFKQYHPAHDRFQPEPMVREGKVSFEYSFMIPLDMPGFPLHPSGEPILFAGRLDGKGRYDTLPTFSDEKTTKAIGPQWAQAWPMRNQFQGYGWAMRHLGFPHRRCLVRGVAIQKTQIKLQESLNYYPDHVLDQWEHMLKYDLHTMVDMHNAKMWPARIGEACTSFGSCEYTPVCLASPRTQEALVDTYGFNDWQPGTPHPTPNLIQLYQEPRDAITETNAA